MITHQKSGSSTLIGFEFSRSGANGAIALEPMTPTSLETWNVRDTVGEGVGEGQITAGDCFTKITVAIDNVSDTEKSAYEAYKRIFSALKSNDAGNLVRIWNFIPHINQKEGDYESSYHAFNSGRARAWQEHGPKKMGGAPKTCAATGMGVFNNSLTLIGLASKCSSVRIENPRQIETLRYPKKYGPKPPLFSRAMVVSFPAGNRLLFLSGTGSILGADTVHVGNPKDQLEEIFKNIEAIIGEDNLSRYDQAEFSMDKIMALRVYAKSERNLDLIQAALSKHLPGLTDPMILKSNLCRPDLDFEIEAVFEG